MSARAPQRVVRAASLTPARLVVESTHPPSHAATTHHPPPPCRDGDGEINEEEFLRIMKKTSLY